MLDNLTSLIPELVIALGSMFILMVGVLVRNRASDIAHTLAALLLVAALAIIVSGPRGPDLAFSGMFIADDFARFVKVLILLGSLTALLMAADFLKRFELDRFEYPVLVLLATLGMMMMVSANDLLALYLGLELQSLSLYVLAAINRDRLRSNEAGLKYFVLGALSSGMLLYGISLIYGFAGGINFDALAGAVGSGDNISVGLIVGLVFFMAGLAFKISAVPFHMWTPDVYEGSPTPVTAFFAAAPKVAAMALFLRGLLGPFPELVSEWRQIIIFLSILSMVLGAFAAFVQSNIKRLLAFSSIGHVGYALVGLAAGTQEGVQGVLFYLAFYLTMTLGAFAVVLVMRRREGMSEDIADLAGLARNSPSIALAMAIFMFSLAGVPPMIGFWSKVEVFLPAVEAGLTWLAVIGAVTSVVGAYYYLKIVRIMYVDEPAHQFEPLEDRRLGGTIAVTALLNSPLGFLLAGPVIASASVAAQALVP